MQSKCNTIPYKTEKLSVLYLAIVHGIGVIKTEKASDVEAFSVYCNFILSGSFFDFYNH